ncbi:RING finger-containing protein, putative [Candida dubliniensis CD36]|uniref:RING-type E3 ubiquitin transferase n=1 Tax=Candida dubliniensis (strain CD36 / ATCC MYA-646 / CBS 7987 / NCPF 3949 / NRRL Y-17841) TaxID=573826 RepID=B9WIK9_CANDC|nr:RING finger-containing protein, putative [Candida dubliniensis CD36]CAX41074.1 RING finger-containing protein, putative [Candida dubliniensis CD36]
MSIPQDLKNTTSTTTTTTTTTTKRSRVSRGGSKQNTTSRRGGERGKGYKKNINLDENSQSNQQVEEIPEDEQCIICAERIKYAALTPCNHTTCHKCTFRQRSLYEKTTCLICRSENDKIIITELINKNYDEIFDNDIIGFNEKYKIKFTKDYIEKDTLSLLKNTCSICQETFSEFKLLIDHGKEIHGKYYCLICCKFKKVFKPELPLYTYKQLQRHQIDGDGDGNGNETGFTGHPECKHCHGKRFYSEDELNVHIRDRHERCYICDQNNPKTADYYKNYDTLYIHFTKVHYVCTVASCIEKRFVVFRDDLDLTAHMLKEHGGITRNGNTNNNNRVIIGSNSHHFSQLSTFNEGNSRRNRDRNRDRDHGSAIGWMGEDDEILQQSPEIKKKRFEERAKHYLNYNQIKIKEFHSLNNNFKNKNINANELLLIYKRDLFIHQTQEELNILIKEFSEFFPNNSELYKDLISIIKDNNNNNNNNNIFEFDSNTPHYEQFPILGGMKANSNIMNSNWVNTRNGSSSPSSSSSTTTTINEKFPALSKPTKKNYVNPNNQPIKYTTVLKPQPNKKKTVLNISQSSNDYIPNYLNNINKASSFSSSSMPILGNSNSNSINSGGGGSSNSSSLVSSRNNSSTTLDDKKFPTLQKKQTKKIIIPRVNQIKVIDPNTWGKQQFQSIKKSTNINNEVDNGNGIEIIDKRKQKMKRKQDKLLFSNAI